jgi:hypothetical protein
MGSALESRSWFVPWRERRRFCCIERSVVRDHEAGQLAILRGLAAARGGLTSVLSRSQGCQAVSAELVIGGRRVQIGRMHRGTVGALAGAVAGTAPVPLLAAGRYGPYWVLTFGLAAAPLPVLADRLVVLPD